MPSTARTPPLNSRTRPATSIARSSVMGAAYAGKVEVVNCRHDLLLSRSMDAGLKQHTPLEDAWALLGQLFWQMRPRMVRVAGEFGLSPPQLFALRTLDPDNPVPMSTLAAALHCDNSNVTGLVDGLEAQGLVERRPGQRDRRVRMVVVTDRGAQVRGRLIAAI